VPDDDARFDQVLRLLGRTLEEADGPVATDDLLALARAEGLDEALAEQALDEVLDQPSRYATVDGRALSRWVGLDGARLAHRLTADELRHGLLVPGADLSVLDGLFDPDQGDLFVGEGVHLQQVLPAFDGDLLDLYEIPRDEVGADGGWLLVGRDLSGAAPGDVIVFAIDDAEVTLLGPDPASIADVPAAFDELTARGVAGALLDAWRDLAQLDLDRPDPDRVPTPDEMPVGLDELILETLIRDRRLLAPGSPPLSDTLAGAGWVSDGTFVGAEGTDFGLAARTLEIAELSMFYRLGQEQAVALGHLLQLFEDVKAAVGGDAATPGLDRFEGGDEDLDRYRRTPPGDAPAPDPSIDLGDDAVVVLSWLVDPDVTAAFVSQAIGIRTDHAPALFQFAAAAQRRAPRAAAAACLWLEAKALDRLGHTLEAAERIDEAIRLDRDRDLAPLLLDAANLASDRGDVDAALRFARDAGLDERDDFVRMLSALVPTPPPGIGRNDPCFCGSGRKYKQCHLGRVDLDLDQRAGWLYRKALVWLQDRTWRLRLIELADAYAADDNDDDQVLQLAMHEPFIADLALSDDRAWDDFLADRGVLLPDDERQLAERWGQIGRSVFEVVGVEPGATVEVRDLRDPDGATATVVEHAYSRQAQVGDLILARVLPAGTAPQFIGGIVAISAISSDAVIDALDAGDSGLELARLIGSLRVGPAITNTEGEPLIFCGATYRVDPAATRAALDTDPAVRADVDRPTDGEDEGIDPFDAGWVEEITIDGRDWIRARYTLRGDELVLEANSEARIERARERVERSVSGAELIDEEQRPLDHLAQDAPFDPRALLGDQPEITPELQALLDQLTLGDDAGTEG
jgi:tetratricopeptide (TPR) repeat protein